MKSLLVVMSIFAVTGCTSINTIDHDYKDYILGEVKTVAVGGTMLSEQNGEIKEIKEWVGVLNSIDGWRTREEYSPQFYRKELLYNGIGGENISISYREYRQGLASPAFYQNLQYSLDYSDEIRFQNYLIKVITADNQYIEFKVVAD